MKYRVSILSLLLAAALALPAGAALAAPRAAGNSAPIAEDLELSTYKDIAITSRFAATDPDGDPVTFQIVGSPARGRLTLDENDSAAFWYTPYEGKKGKDSFTYVAVDDKGNVSQPATVRIVISKQTTKVTYSDMAGEAGAYAAVRLAEEDIYVGRRVGSLYCFDPGETFTREEFLALAMETAGVEPVSGVTVTGFFDNDAISVWARGYVSAALMDGAVRGSKNEQGQAVFMAAEPITCAQAAVIIDRLLAMEDVKAEPTAAAPAWCAQAAANLETVSVLPAGADLTADLTRSEGAQMLSAMLDVLQGREKKGWFK